jgi:hypothetical protein
MSDEVARKAAEFKNVGKDLDETRGKRRDQSNTLRKARREEAV